MIKNTFGTSDLDICDLFFPLLIFLEKSYLLQNNAVVLGGISFSIDLSSSLTSFLYRLSSLYIFPILFGLRLLIFPILLFFLFELISLFFEILFSLFLFLTHFLFIIFTSIEFFSGVAYLILLFSYNSIPFLFLSLDKNLVLFLVFNDL